MTWRGLALVELPAANGKNGSQNDSGDSWPRVLCPHLALHRYLHATEVMPRSRRNHGARLGASGCTFAATAPLWRRYTPIVAQWHAPLAHVCREGGTVIVSERFMSDSRNAVPLEKGLKGRIQRLDEDGNAFIDFDGLEEHCMQWVMTWNFDKLRAGDIRFAHLRGIVRTPGCLLTWNVFHRVSLAIKCNSRQTRFTPGGARGVTLCKVAFPTKRFGGTVGGNCATGGTAWPIRRHGGTAALVAGPCACQ
eukprot:gene10344-biopygen2536